MAYRVMIEPLGSPRLTLVATIASPYITCLDSRYRWLSLPQAGLKQESIPTNLVRQPSPSMTPRRTNIFAHLDVDRVSLDYLLLKNHKSHRNTRCLDTHTTTVTLTPTSQSTTIRSPTDALYPEVRDVPPESHSKHYHSLPRGQHHPPPTSPLSSPSTLLLP